MKNEWRDELELTVRGADRRKLAQALVLASGAMSFGGVPCVVLADPSGASHANDWDWLVGQWDVWHRRLKERLAGNNEWEEFGGKSAFWRTWNGLGNIDDNVIDIPSGAYRGLSLRTFNARTKQWAIWWLDGRNPTYIEPPVMGSFARDVGTFEGRDTFKGRPIIMRFRWNEIHGQRPWWEQAFSPDEGASWEVNWRNYFTRVAAQPSPLPPLDDAPKDWGFLVGKWRVRHRRLAERFSSSERWDEFGGSCVNWPVLGGFGNVDDNVMQLPTGVVHGMGLCAFDRVKNEWVSWWIDDRDAGSIGTPLKGTFKDGVATFVGKEVVAGREITSRVQWSHITPRSVRWEQASTNDGGQRWEANWVSEFEREA